MNLQQTVFARRVNLTLPLVAVALLATAAITNAAPDIAANRPAPAPGGHRAGNAAQADGEAALEMLLAAGQLQRAALVRTVLLRNPDLQAAELAWQAAAARPAQAVSLDDPMVKVGVAPLSIGSSEVRYGQTFEIEQRLPWPGKRELDARIAAAAADASRADLEETRQELALVTSMLFDGYWAAGRSLALNEEHHRLVRDRKATAAGHYEVTHAAQAEPLTAEVELAHVVHRGVVLTAERAVILARINGLLHRRPEEPLPPAPDRPDIAIGDLSDAAAFQTEALARRPERLRGEALVRGSDLGVERAEIDYFPDFTVSTGYSSMWREGEHQWMAGFGFDLPLALGRRRAAVDEAEARRMEARSRLEGTEDRIRVEVETARQRLMEAHHVLAVYRERLLPTAKARIDSARINYTTGLGAFEEMIAAERALRDLEIQNVEAVADLGRRRAEFERALGRTPGLGKESGQ